ncbi:MAG TPA: DNA gyrase subunit A, partial [Flavobacteriales bacterium]|nr:DNA gyrase subunit A [Flavobacteriales bacterium]
EIPEGSKTSKGRAIQNLINIPPDDKIKTFINIKDLKDEEFINNNYIILCTEKGVVKKTTVALYSKPRTNGIIAIKIREGDHLLEAKLTDGNSQILMGLKSGKAIRFLEEKVRPMGRGASGVKGITLADEKDEVIGMVCVKGEDETILVVAEKGIGKRSHIDDYRITNRGGKGVKTINITSKTGKLIALKNVVDGNDLMIINKSGIMIRMSVDKLRVMGRATQGVKLIDLKDKDSIAAVTKVEIEEEDENDALTESHEPTIDGENGVTKREDAAEAEDADMQAEEEDTEERKEEEGTEDREEDDQEDAGDEEEEDDKN